MRCDETATFLIYSVRSVPNIISNYSTPNNHIFHTLLVKASTWAFGTEPWAIRMPAFLAGVLLIPAVFWVGASLKRCGVGLLSAALVASSSVLIDYSSNARGYTVVTLLFVCGLPLWASCLRKGQLAPGVAVAMLCSLGAWTNPIMLYPFCVMLSWLGWGALLRKAGPGRRRRVHLTLFIALACGFLTALLYAPVLIGSGPWSLVGNQHVRPLESSVLLAGAPSYIRELWSFLVRDIPGFVQVAGGVGAVLSVLRWGRWSVWGPPLLLVHLGTCVLLLALQRVLPFQRVWLFVVPLLVLLSVFGWSRMIPIRVSSSRSATFVATCALVMFGALICEVHFGESVVSSEETGALIDAPAISAVITEQRSERDLIGTCYESRGIAYYLWSAGCDSKIEYESLVPSASPAKLWLVVHHRVETLEALSARLGLRPESWGAPVLVQDFTQSSLYVATRTGD